MTDTATGTAPVPAGQQRRARTGTLAALIAALVVLAVSIAAVVVYAANHRTSAPTATASGNLSDLGGWTTVNPAPTDGSTGGQGWSGMMGDGHDQGEGMIDSHDGTMMGGTVGAAVDVTTARGIAQDWADQQVPGATVNAGIRTGNTYRFTVTRDGQAVALVVVDATTGRYAVRLLPSPSPTA